jgi:hypothetical protein
MKSFLRRLLTITHHPIQYAKPMLRRSIRNKRVRWVAFSSKSWEDKIKIVGLMGLKVGITANPLFKCPSRMAFSSSTLCRQYTSSTSM